MMTKPKEKPKDEAPQDVTELQTALTKQNFSLVPKTMGEALEFANMIAKSDAVPEHYQNKAANVFVALMYGLELGLTPMTTVQNTYVVNGKVNLFGEIGIAMIMTHPEFIDIEETFDDKSATCTVSRIIKQTGKTKTVTRGYTMADAIKAKLDKKDNWVVAQKRMLQFRARWWAIKDLWADVLKGIGIADRETGDYIDAESERVPTYEFMLESIERCSTPEEWAGMRDTLAKYQAEYTVPEHAELANKLNAMKTKIGVVTKADETKAQLESEVERQAKEVGQEFRDPH